MNNHDQEVMAAEAYHHVQPSHEDASIEHLQKAAIHHAQAAEQHARAARAHHELSEHHQVKHAEAQHTANVEKRIERIRESA